MCDRKKILILGASGLLGSTLSPYLIEKGYNIVTHSRTDESANISFELEHWDKAEKGLSIVSPDVIINLVGLASVENCQQYTNFGYLSNTRTVENIARWIEGARPSCHLIQISTDHVYDGKGPHVETETTLTNNYAITKYAGEIAASKVASTVLRTNFVGKSKVVSRESLTDWVYISLSANKNVRVLSDVLFAPLNMETLSAMIELVIDRKPLGTFNLGSNEGMSKADFDFAFATKLGLRETLMTRILSSEARFFSTYRPKDMRMNCSKFEKYFGVRLPTLSEEIEKSVMEYYEGS